MWAPKRVVFIRGPRLFEAQCLLEEIWYCKSEIELSGQQKVMEGIVVEGPLADGFTNEKTVVKETVKKLEAD